MTRVSRVWGGARVTVVAVLLGCGQAATPPPKDTTTPPVVPAREPASSPASAPPRAVTTQRAGDGRCTPEPREGAACAAGDSWCVLDWGNPGGASSALWCRDGHWVLELERNRD